MTRDQQTETSTLAEENRQVLNLVQAMIGAISPNFRAVTLDCAARSIRLHFLLERDDPDDREEIDDIVFEFEALQEEFVAVDVHIEVSMDPGAPHRLRGRRVYGRRES